ncbi:restriction endonuclease [Kitasatospora purpeofusca]|uniref:restriction endonuclease n=1 Tax=Kitasatospora purpeofusca TaxID=67352 RepID=UPI00224E96AA|nr:restriction endonuclease [Kitasatospora purpeofusca]MCX4752444.1 restriction endonuclease [Kitasatospora purpeofusca]WSR32017.1 restriction endonuclease [Kitasatospora purpeofusca]
MAFESVIGQVIHGWSPNRSALGTCKASDPGAVRLIWLRHIGRDGSIAERDEDSDWRSDVPDRSRLQAGDIVLSRIVSGRPKAAGVQEADLPAAAMGGTVVLRPVSPLAPEHERLILAFLRSDAVGSLVSGEVIPRIQLTALKALGLPRNDEALSAALGDLAAAGRRLGAWSTDAVALADTVFDRGTDLTEARRAILAAGQVTRLRAEAAAELDAPDYIARTRLPYPVALRWREAEVRMSAGDRRIAYTATLGAAESLLAYTALVAAALAREAKIDLTSVADVQRKLANAPGGPGFGDWASILTEVGGKKCRSLRLDHPLHELGALLKDEAADKARIRLAGRRNDYAHDRQPTDVELPAALDEVYEDLSTLRTRALFLADLPLIHVTGVAWDDFRGEETISFRRLMGDHSVVPTSTMPYKGDRVETGSLYLADRDHRLYRLRPFLTCELCEKCHTWSVFHADKIKAVGLVQKSLEHGHHYPYRGDTQVLQAAGLL